MEPSTQTPRYAELFIEGLKDANVTVVAAVPESLLATVYCMCAKDNAIRYIPVTNEAELPGICAGTYLAGKKGIMVMENSGLRRACEPIARFAYCHAMPLVMAMSFRGEWGERNWWGHNHAQTMEPILNALRIPFRFVARLDDIKPTIRKAYYHADSSNWPVAMVFTGECVEVPAYAKDCGHPPHSSGRHQGRSADDVDRPDLGRLVEPQAGRQYVLHWDSRVRDDHGPRAGGLAAASPHHRHRDRRVGPAQHRRHVHARKGAATESHRGRHGQRHLRKYRRAADPYLGQHRSRQDGGAGCLNCVTARGADEFDRQLRRMLGDDQMGYLVAKIEPWAKHKWEWKDRKATDGVEDKYRFLRYVEKLEGVVIHPGAVQN
jgi:sulfopyruvate decarboxylase subunit alpha